MQLEQQVVSLELAKKLKELGVKQESLFWWWEKLGGGYSSVIQMDGVMTADGAVVASAFSVAELGEMLPPSIEISGSEAKLKITKEYLTQTDVNWHIWYGRWRNNAAFKDENLADAMAKMLIYLIENGLKICAT